MTSAEEPETASSRGPAPMRDLEAEALLAELYEGRELALADELVARLSVMFPAVSSELGDQFRIDLLDRATFLLRGAMLALTTGESLEPLGPAIERVARIRREQRVSQEIIFSGYRFLQQTLFERIAQDVRDHPHAGRLLAALGLRQLEFQWMVARRVAAAFDTGPDVLAANRAESMQALLETLIGIRPGAPMLESHATRFGLLLPLDHIAVTVPVDVGEQPRSLNEPTVRALARANPWAVVGTLEGRAVVISRGAPWELGVPWGGCDLPPDVVDKPVALAELVERATAAADVASQLGLAHGDADELAPFIAVAGLPTARREAFLRSCFGDLHGSVRGEPLLEAVAASLRCASRREAAQELHVHPNTLDYRLARFRELTGLDLHNAVDRMRCDLGLFLAGLLVPSAGG